MAAEISDLPLEVEEFEENFIGPLNPSLRYLKLIKNVKDEYPDCPQKPDDMSFENFHETVKEYLKIKGLKQYEDFSDIEKEAIVEECMINFTDLKVLSQKCNTMTCIIKSFVQEAGLRVTTPDILSKYPDYPKKTDEMSKEEYYKIITKFWNTKRRQNFKEKKKAARELRAQEILLDPTMNPEDLTDHPNFPEYSEGTTDEVYAGKIEIYWQDRRKAEELERKRKEEEEEKESERKRPKKMPVHGPLQRPKWTKKRKLDDIDAEERLVIYDKRIHKARALELVAKEHDTFVEVINEIISLHLGKSHHEPIVPKTKTQNAYPDYPVRTVGMSKEEHQEELKKWFKLKGKGINNRLAHVTICNSYLSIISQPCPIVF